MVDNEPQAASAVTCPEGVTPASEADDMRDAGKQEDRLVETDLLVEDASIDGMCGVY